MNAVVPFFGVSGEVDKGVENIACFNVCDRNRSGSIHCVHEGYGNGVAVVDIRHRSGNGFRFCRDIRFNGRLRCRCGTCRRCRCVPDFKNVVQDCKTDRVNIDGNVLQEDFGFAVCCKDIAVALYLIDIGWEHVVDKLSVNDMSGTVSKGFFNALHHGVHQGYLNFRFQNRPVVEQIVNFISCYRQPIYHIGIDIFIVYFRRGGRACRFIRLRLGIAKEVPDCIIQTIVVLLDGNLVPFCTCSAIIHITQGIAIIKGFAAYGGDRDGDVNFSQRLTGLEHADAQVLQRFGQNNFSQVGFVEVTAAADFYQTVSKVHSFQSVAVRERISANKGDRIRNGNFHQGFTRFKGKGVNAGYIFTNGNGFQLGTAGECTAGNAGDLVANDDGFHFREILAPGCSSIAFVAGNPPIVIITHVAVSGNGQLMGVKVIVPM